MMTSIKRAAAVAICLTAVLQGCGGGGDGSGATTTQSEPTSSLPATQTPASTAAATPSEPATVTPMLAAESAYNFSVSWSGGGSDGPVSEFTQTEDGSITAVNEFSLGSPREIKDISYGPNYALGRWVNGTVTNTSDKTTTQLGADEKSYHYVLVKKLTHFPQAGTFTCDNGVFTTPTLGTFGTSTHPATGIPSGQVTLSFSAAGAAVAGSLQVNTGSSTGTLPLNALHTGGEGSSSAAKDPWVGHADVQLGLGGDGAYALAFDYVVKVNNAFYNGVAKFRCS